MHNGGRRGINSNQKAKDFLGTIKKLIDYNKSLLVAICIGLGLSFVASILSIIGPDKLKEMTNVITAGLMVGIDLKSVEKIGITLICIYSLSLLFDYIQSIIMATVTNKFSYKMRKEISERINKLPLSYFDKTTIGDILSRVTNDVDTMCQTMNQSLGSLVSAITSFIGSIIMMFYTNYILAICAIASSVFGFVFMSYILKRSQKYFSAVQNELGNINGHIEEVFSGHSIVKVYNAKEEMINEFDDINERLFENGRKSQFYSGLMQPFMNFIGNFGYVVVCIVGAILTMNHIIDFGVIVAFMLYVRLFTNPLSTIAQSLNQLQSAAAAGERVFEFLETEEMPLEDDKKIYLDKKKVKGDISFEHVKFGYDDKKIVIKDFTANVKAGQKVAIVGPTGAGKTTMVNLLMKFYDIKDGDIKIDGVSIHDLKRENVHELFTMVLQDTWVFEGTIKENLKFNSKNITDKDIIKACKTVGLDHFIKTLPHGLNTMLGDVESLSAGQKQLLTIARSSLEDAPFLILDEATSSVDTRTEELVQKAMDKLTEGRTSFIIAHRLSTIRNSDLILVVKDGNIVEQGNHKKLLKEKGFYAELYNSQFRESKN